MRSVAAATISPASAKAIRTNRLPEPLRISRKHSTSFGEHR
jgi:hypothetical protein